MRRRNCGMFDFLKEIDGRLYERYLTLERNVKAGSNSFYDAYLDMQEHFVKLVCDGLSMELQKHDSCGEILRRQEMKAFFKETLGVDEYHYEKMKDYTKKVNAHKHKGEKTVQIETVVNYLRVFHTVSSAYAAHLGISAEELNAGYYISVFGIFEKENAALQRQLAMVQGLKDIDEFTRTVLLDKVATITKGATTAEIKEFIDYLDIFEKYRKFGGKH